MVALVSDVRLESPLPVFLLDEADGLADFVVSTLGLRRSP